MGAATRAQAKWQLRRLKTRSRKAVNRLCQRHHQIFYNAPAIDHVSEQIEVLYQQQRNDKTPGQDGLDVLSGQADLSDPWSIGQLPEIWPNEEYGADEIYDAYKQLVGQVSSMAAGLVSLRSRHERLLCLRNKISVLEKPQEKIQPNLVFKDSELALELKRMRILAAKLAYELDVSKPMQL
ncbi:hypothetical protein TWF106_008894 [Orbilia oligospora]|uniref:Uncharacterized protein n=1 Tax=Orbilia oligospora TaxID=2813651 RepID=A0A6G1LVZ4_ORBOL|nr:hypothetical protein TWF106_008894 [Orbilia oligospora]KAF3235826.1 hypothetical protein TWF192_000641 [Orbilia oligospora]